VVSTRKREIAWLLMTLMLLSTFGYAILSSWPEEREVEEELIMMGYTIVKVVNLTNESLKEFFDDLPSKYETNLGERQVVVIYESFGNFSGVSIKSQLGERVIDHFNESEIKSALCDLLLFKSISCLNLTGETP